MGGLAGLLLTFTKWERIGAMVTMTMLLWGIAISATYAAMWRVEWTGTYQVKGLNNIFNEYHPRIMIGWCYVLNAVSWILLWFTSLFVYCICGMRESTEAGKPR